MAHFRWALSGETSFGSFARKRYRFTGKERDEESGFSYHAARYYASYLGRWISADTLCLSHHSKSGPTPEQTNAFSYARDNPIVFVDQTGLAAETVNEYLEGLYSRHPEIQQQAAQRLLRFGLAEQHRNEPLQKIGSQGPEYEQIMLSKDTIRWAQISGEISLAIFGEALAAEMAPTLFGFGNQGRLAQKGGFRAVGRWFWDPRKFKTVGNEYWKISGGAFGRELHHWIFPQRWLKYASEYFPRLRLGLTNSGFNLLELPGWLNNWLGRGALRELKEGLFRLGVLKLLYETVRGSFKATSNLIGGSGSQRSSDGGAAPLSTSGVHLSGGEWSATFFPSSSTSDGPHLGGRDWSASLLSGSSTK